MTVLDALMPDPRLAEVDAVDVDAPVAEVWARVRHASLAAEGPTRALFALRTLLDRDRGATTPSAAVRIDDMRSSPEHPGFQILADDPPREVAVGAIGQVWRLRIPFVHVADAAAFARFATPCYVKVAWAIRLTPREGGTRVEVEVRVTATDDATWRRFRRYFAVIGPGSRYIRHALLRTLAREFDRPAERACAAGAK